MKPISMLFSGHATRTRLHAPAYRQAGVGRDTIGMLAPHGLGLTAHGSDNCLCVAFLI